MKLQEEVQEREEGREGLDEDEPKEDNQSKTPKQDNHRESGRCLGRFKRESVRRLQVR